MRWIGDRKIGFDLSHNNSLGINTDLGFEWNIVLFLSLVKCIVMRTPGELVEFIQLESSQKSVLTVGSSFRGFLCTSPVDLSSLPTAQDPVSHVANTRLEQYHSLAIIC